MLIVWISLKVHSHSSEKYASKTHNISFAFLLADNFLFRFTVAVPREVALLKKEVTLKGITKYRDTAESLHLERDTVLLPRLTVSLNT